MRSRRPAPDSSPSTPSSALPLPEEVRDWRGRSYAMGPSARALTGRSRRAILLRALTAAAAVGGLQFGYGAAVPSLVAAHGWSPAQALVPFLAWTLVQGACAPALHRLRARGAVRAGPAVQAGALLCAAALVSLGVLPSLPAAVLGYGLLGGLGAGLVYHSCTHLVDGWFPDRRTVRSGAVGGAFALGWVPLLPAVAVGVSPSALPVACGALALLVAVLGLVGGAGQRRPRPGGGRPAPTRARARCWRAPTRRGPATSPRPRRGPPAAPCRSFTRWSRCPGRARCPPSPRCPSSWRTAATRARRPPRP
ncbi:hypothetical protein Ndas_4118 [Nocardiopsis dassonvillei subsp. dassonvillei DSM 43111]|uniref:Major facilitator superfamily MFS_1 n=1 Tax=Nocardiopsis dassonvillei (strain ATCC 23218 / DSM 43111 / CIP 107115 / JCM 7437 / KCTC 9190 / NBRC 14626 / NCTC 10488 / NRRL B-5397 / IMRU 509) TaxID=446468 RepID=D7AUW3_NOCDD|nr:hypothetical protein Ndas_4118 [Nocardiopsis dassonvillei subsp. dassonvillei DSM 43111]